MNIDITEKDGIKLVKLVGNLDGMSSETAAQEILPIIKDNIKMTIDMSECHYVSSAGLRTLLTIGKSVKMKNGDMNIVNLIEEVKDVMEMTGFSSIFKGFEG